MLLLALAVALALAACGGGGETTTVEAGAPTPVADTDAIEELIVDYGVIDDPEEGCELFSRDYLANLGGLKDCLSDRWFVARLEVGEVSLDGDTADVIVVRENARESRLPVVREGEPSDAYDGWRIAGEAKPTDAPAEGDSTTPEPETESSPQTPEQKAAAYRDCIEGRGAKDVKQDDFPSVDFSGGGSRVIASFGSSQADAEQGLASIKQRDPFFVERVGTAVVFAVGDPLADDLEIGLSCVKEID